MLLTTSSHPRSESHSSYCKTSHSRVWLWAGHMGSCWGLRGLHSLSPLACDGCKVCRLCPGPSPAPNPYTPRLCLTGLLCLQQTLRLLRPSGTKRPSMSVGVGRSDTKSPHLYVGHCPRQAVPWPGHSSRPGLGRPSRLSLSSWSPAWTLGAEVSMVWGCGRERDPSKDTCSGTLRPVGITGWGPLDIVAPVFSVPVQSPYHSARQLREGGTPDGRKGLQPLAWFLRERTLSS